MFYRDALPPQHLGRFCHYLCGFESYCIYTLCRRFCTHFMCINAYKLNTWKLAKLLGQIQGRFTRENTMALDSTGISTCINL